MRLAVIVLFLCFMGCRERVNRVEWTTMGTVAAVQWRGEGGDEMKQIVTEVKRTFKEIETLLNAHSPTSEISRLAPLSNDEILAACHPLVRPCYQQAFTLQAFSESAFNPRWRGEKTLDLGGIAKGFALDVAGERIRSRVRQDLLLDIGGNLLSVRGTWRTGIYGSSETIELKEGSACATSANYFRGHHIIDGRTGRPATNDFISVTVLVPAFERGLPATLADGFSTTFFVLGPKGYNRGLGMYSRRAEITWVTK